MGIRKSLKILLFVLLFFFYLPQATAYATADAVHYSIELRAVPEESTVYGRTTITVNATGLETLILELDEDLVIKSVHLGRKALNFSRVGKEVEVDFNIPLQGVFDLLLEYEGALDEKVSGHGWAYMDKESVYAVHESLWYPQIPGDRAPATINLQVPTGWTGVSNGEIVSSNDDKGYIWAATSQEVGFSFAGGRYMEDQTYTKHLPITCYLLAPKEGCSETLKEILGFFSSTLIPYPYPKLALAEVKGSLNGGHGDGSLTIMSDAIIRSPNFEEFLAHEISHNWFGSMVTAKDTRWLSEGLATYAGIMYLESRDKGLAERSLNAKRTEYMRIRRRQKDTPILAQKDEHDDVFHATVYSKGAYVFHMLRYVVGDEVFFETLQSYVDTYRWESAGIEEFRKTAEEASGMELEWFFAEWLNSTASPDFWIDSVDVRHEGKEYILSAALRQGKDVVKMPVEVTIVTSEGETKRRVWMDSGTSRFEFNLENEPLVLVVDKDEWLLERDRSNNRHVIRYPLSLYGLRLFFRSLTQHLGEIAFF